MFRTPSKTDQAKDAAAAGAEKVSDGARSLPTRPQSSR